MLSIWRLKRLDSWVSSRWLHVVV